jgi:hypothetical protein
MTRAHREHDGTAPGVARGCGAADTVSASDQTTALIGRFHTQLNCIGLRLALTLWAGSPESRRKSEDSQDVESATPGL